MMWDKLFPKYVFVKNDSIKADAPKNTHIFDAPVHSTAGTTPSFSALEQSALCGQERKATGTCSSCGDRDSAITEAARRQVADEKICGNCVRRLYADEDTKAWKQSNPRP